MRTYFRILSFARPLGNYVPQYIVLALLAIIFGLINLTLLIPLFDVMFNQMSPEMLAQYRVEPEFAFTTTYLKHIFYHQLIGFTETYDRMGALIFVCIVIITANLLANAFKYSSLIVLATLRARVVKNIRNTIFGRITQLHLGFFTTERKGDIMSRITNDVQEIENTIVHSLQVVFRDPATIILYFIALFIMSPKLTLFTLILLPISGALISGIAKRLRKRAIQSQETLGRILNLVEETLSGMRIVKAFTARNYILTKFNEEVDQYAHINVSMARKNELASPLSEFLGVFAVAGILLYGGNLVLVEGYMDGATFLAYLAIFTQVLTPAKDISRAISVVQRGLVSAERIFKIVDTKPEIIDQPDAVELTGIHESIEFRNVSFSYERHKTILKEINLTFKKGKTVALVGPSGGGKSTIADLIPRFYDPSDGEILIDGKPVKSFKIESIRQKMGIVTQESILFNDTVFNNIAFGQPGTREEDVIHAAKIANAHDFIVQMENEYHTIIGERGTKLSGGQRQRLSIARAVLKNPPILILDEATSALDSESEKLVQEAMTVLMQHRTSIVIAHRLSTIQHADEIIVVHNGEIVERGTHDTLIQRNGLYTRLKKMQSV